jgi:hypothetical protein
MTRQMQPEGGWDIRRNGHPWAKPALRFYLSDYPEKPEVDGGKLFWSEEDRLIVLGLLLENLGVDKAVRLGNPEVWKEAVKSLG